jgi:putative transposase
VSTLEGWLFLAVVVDRQPQDLGWSMREDLQVDLVVDALRWPSPAADRRPAFHYSDRGSQYGSLAFGRTLRESSLLASMGSRGDAFDNAACESCISTLEEEWIKRHRYQSRDQARLSIFRCIETFYNRAAGSRRNSGTSGRGSSRSRPRALG